MILLRTYPTTPPPPTIPICLPPLGGSGTRSPLIFWETSPSYLRILFSTNKETKKLIIFTKIGKNGVDHSLGPPLGGSGKVKWNKEVNK